MTALPTLTVTPKWDGDRLMLGRLAMGVVTKGPLNWFARGAHDRVLMPFPTEAAARSALVEAVVRAIGGGA